MIIDKLTILSTITKIIMYRTYMIKIPSQSLQKDRHYNKVMKPELGWYSNF